MTNEQAKYKLLSYAMDQLGYREGANNWNKYAAMQEMTQLLGWNAQNQPWCNVFVNACFVACFGLEIGASMLYQPIGSGSALCRASADFFKAACAWIERGRTPEPGDVIFFYRSGDVNHMGIVSRVAGSSVVTVEGNSSDSVAERLYSVSDNGIAGYGRPQWALAAGIEQKPGDDEQKTADNVQESKKHARYYTLRLPYLSRGSKGIEVAAAQGLLQLSGYNLGRWGVDGDYGTDTAKAVREFQTVHKLTPDGIIGPATGAALYGGEVVVTNINGLGAAIAQKIKEGET